MNQQRASFLGLVSLAVSAFSVWMLQSATDHLLWGLAWVVFLILGLVIVGKWCSQKRALAFFLTFAVVQVTVATAAYLLTRQ
ncbi:MAG TPA: hypothetical protein VGK74_25290 [Symbiobacteriaceae bacterium]|jgi:hypothetical protein